MKKLFKTLASAALAACMAASVLPVSTLALGGGVQLENGISTYAASGKMLSSLAGNSGLDLIDMTNFTAGSTLNSGIYYITKDVTLNENKACKNALAVAENATAYIYIPANVTLTVYGKDGTPAGVTPTGTAGNKNNADGNPVVDEYYEGNPLRLTERQPKNIDKSTPGSAGTAATGGGAAIYVPKGAKLVVLGSGTLKAIGGKGGDASKGAAGTSTYYWLSCGSSGELYYQQYHNYTNNENWNDFWLEKPKTYSTAGACAGFGIQAGAGGTGGNGAGGGGAAIGTNGQAGNTGALGAEGNATTDYYVVTQAAYEAPWTAGTAATDTVAADPAGDIYIVDPVKIHKDTAAGAGGNAQEDHVAEVWQNSPVVDTDNAQPRTISDTAERFAMQVHAHITANGKRTPDETPINLYVTNARRGGNGGAGGIAAKFGAGGAGGGGGGGGDSGSVNLPIYSSGYKVAASHYGTDGASVTATAESTQKVWDPANLPYNTITFVDADGTTTLGTATYVLQKDSSIAVPGYNGNAVTAATEFTGWEVAAPAAELPTVFDSSTSENSAKLTRQNAVLQPGDTIAATGIYGNVVLKARVTAKDTYTILQGDGVADVQDAAGAALGAAYETQSVTVTAEDRTANGWKLTGFTVAKTGGSPADAQQISLISGTRKATFTMPAYPVTVTANYEAIAYAITISAADGTAQATATVGTEVVITPAASAEGEEITSFTVTNTSDNSTFEVTADAGVYKFTMPAANVSIKANRGKIVYNVTVDHSYVDKTAATSGETVTITGYVDLFVTESKDFDGFTVTGSKGGTVTPVPAGDGTGYYTFTMPADNVTVKADYIPHAYSLTVFGGAATGGQTTAHYNDEVELVAAPAAAGRHFTGWKFSANVSYLDGTGASSSTVKIRMPNADLTATAEYADTAYRVTVERDGSAIYGTASPAEGVLNDRITLTADDRTAAGYDFLRFEVTRDDTGAAVGVAMDGTAPNGLTGSFALPASNVTVKVVYQARSYDVKPAPDPDDPENGDSVNGGVPGTACVDESVTITAKDRTAEGWALDRFEVTRDDTGAAVGVAMDGTDPNGLTGSFTMPASSVTVKARYKKIDFAVAVYNGRLRVNDGAEADALTAQVGDLVTLKADADDADSYFTGWKFTANGVPVDDVEIRDGETAADAEIVIVMPAKHLVATATFRNVHENAINFTEDSGFAQVDGLPAASAKQGKEVHITAAAKIGYEFDHWEVTCDEEITGDDFDLSQERTSFVMPGCDVTFTAHYKPIEPGEPSAPTQSRDMISKGEAVGAAVAAVGVGIAVWQGSELAMRIYRNKVIQIDYWPGNRIALAQLIWSRAGSPEPESDVPFADITEALDTLNDTNINAQKAARWCVEQGLLDAKTNDDGTECFQPMKHITHLRVCLTWQNARKMGLFEVPAEAGTPEA